MLPIPELEEHRIQADIPHSLFQKADKIRRERRLKWSQVMQALLEKMVEDLTPRQKPEGSFVLPRTLNEQNVSGWR